MQADTRSPSCITPVLGRRCHVALCALLLGGFAIGLASPSLADTSDLERVFREPPDDARINVRWWWFGPAVTKPGIERELKSMKAGGIGGFEVQPVYPLAVDGSFLSDDGLPVKNVPFMSPAFLDLLHFTSAKAKELGLRVDLTLGSGWPYGGPIFSPSEGAGRLVFRSVKVHGQLTVSAPSLAPGQTLIAAFLGTPSSDRAADTRPGPGFDAQSMQPIPLKDGIAQVPPHSAADAQVVFFVAGRTGMAVKRPALGAEGRVLDHLNPSVVDKFVSQIAIPEIDACSPNPPYSIFCDSLEVAGEDWTDNFLDEFQKRRGYDLRPLLPALLGDVGPKTMEIRHDWGQTLTELFQDAFNTRLKDLAHRSGTRFRLQAYGSPSAGLSSYLSCDLPEGEGYRWHGYDATRYAASASHLLGVPVASSETFTWLHSPVFRATPQDIKAQADMHFLQGVNQIVCHGWPYTPQGVGFPGWAFYAAAVFDQENPWYIAMPDISKYLQRMSTLLRQGQPANDVLLYLANDDAWAAFVPGKVSLSDGVGKRLGSAIIPALLDHGYNFDYFDSALLDARGKAQGGSIAFGDLNYRVIVLAGVERIPLATMKKLQAFAQAGGTLIATRTIPDKVPGYLATEQDQQLLHAITGSLFGPEGNGIFVRDEADVPAALQTRRQPDVAIDPIDPDIGFVHRHTESGELYFLANTSDTAKAFTVSFRTTGRHGELWDPMTAKVAPLTDAHEDGQVTRVAMALAPYESQVVMFADRQLPTASSVARVQALDISQGWNVKFDQPTQGSGPALPAMSLDAGTSWTAHETTRGYSGVATYTKTVNIAADLAGDPAPVCIDFGEGTPLADRARANRGSHGYAAELDSPVRDAAVVYINDQRAGAAWCSPYRVDVTGLLRPGPNVVRIDVANLAVNAIAAAGKYPNYDYEMLRKRFGDRFQPQDVDALTHAQPAGLLGKIVIEAK